MEQNIFMPSQTDLRQVTDRLEQNGITYALGGSTVLASLGLVDQVNDWDVTTDASRDEVVQALKGLSYQEKPTAEMYVSDFCFSFEIGATQIDLIGQYAISNGSQKVKLPTVVTSTWKGLPIGSPRVWAQAYELMGRPEKARLLKEFLSSAENTA